MGGGGSNPFSGGGQSSMGGGGNSPFGGGGQSSQGDANAPDEGYEYEYDFSGGNSLASGSSLQGSDSSLGDSGNPLTGGSTAKADDSLGSGNNSFAGGEEVMM